MVHARPKESEYNDAADDNTSVFGIGKIIRSQQESRCNYHRCPGYCEGPILLLRPYTVLPFRIEEIVLGQYYGN